MNPSTDLPQNLNINSLLITWLLQSLQITPLEVSDFPSPPDPPDPPHQRFYIKRYNAAFLKFFWCIPIYS